MTLPDVFMLFVIVMGGAAALLMVTSRNVVHAALFLVVALLSIAGTFLLVGAEFLAWTQVLVYVGAVVVLILFGLMLTRAPIGPMAQENEQRGLALTVSISLFALLASTIIASFGTVTFTPSVTATGSDLGQQLYTAWAFPFMVLGFFLTVALIGAIIVARREEGEGPIPRMAPAHPDVPEPAPTDASSEPGAPRAQARAGAGPQARGRPGAVRGGTS